jgi:hypothetical protein
MSRGDDLGALLRELGRESVAEPSDEQLRDLLIAVLGAYAERVEERDYALPLDADGHLDRTEVLLVVSRLLEAADLELFEVTMWRAWARS